MLFAPDWSVNHLPQLLLGLAGLLTIALVGVLVLFVRLNRLQCRYRQLLQGVEAENLENMLVEHVEILGRMRRQLEELAAAYERLQGQTQLCVQKLGLVRFNAFQDIGSDLSFSAAFLDAQDNGVVLSSIYGRNESRVYAKPINKGESTYFLSEEEQTALRRAKE